MGAVECAHVILQKDASTIYAQCKKNTLYCISLAIIHSLALVATVSSVLPQSVGVVLVHVFIHHVYFDLGAVFFDAVFEIFSSTGLLFLTH